MNREKPFNDLPLLPPNIDFNNVVLLRKTIDASRKLAELKGIVNSIPNQGLPYSKVSFLEERGIAKRQTAAVYLKRLEEIGLLTSLQKGREVYYINRDLVKVFPQ